MDDKSVIQYVKRTQKDYTMSFKLQVVGEIERGELTIGGAARKGNCWDNAVAESFSRL